MAEIKESIQENRFWKEGFSSAGKVNGSLESLDNAVNSVIQTVCNEYRADVNYQQEQKIAYEQKICDFQSEIEKADQTKNKLKDELAREENKIDEQKARKVDINTYPEKYTKEQPTRKAPFIIGLFVLLLLTIYLFIFYGSASYSAFFKIFSPEDAGFANAVFDAHAYANARNDSITELILIATIPAAFLALGIILHFILEPKTKGTATVIKYVKAGILYLTTFVYDSILAYEITKKIYELNRTNAIFTEQLPEYSLSAAFVDVNFWLIIFSGFVVYLIWGVLYGFVMDAYNKLDTVNRLKQECDNHIIDYKYNCVKIKEKIEKLEADIIKFKAEIDKIRIQISKFFIPIDKLTEAVKIFMLGWVSNTRQLGYSEEYVKEANEKSQQILNEYQLNFFRK